MKYQFAKDFTWGAASSGPQHEGGSKDGGREPSVLDKYYELSPHRFFDGVGPSVCGDFYHRYKEDIELMKELGLTSYRTSMQWSRLLPYGSKTPAPDAVRFYNEVIDCMLDNGVEPYMNLHHFDLPWSVQEAGGWENRATTDGFRFYAETAFKLFGDRVKKWFTFNEPMNVPFDGYMGIDVAYPNLIDMKRGMTVAYHTTLAHALAVDTFRQNGHSGKIGIILNIHHSYPRSQHPADLKATKIADMFRNRAVQDPTLKGIYNQELIEFMADKKMELPILEGDEAIFACGVSDIAGINYYRPQRIKAKEHQINPDASLSPFSYYEPYEMPGRRINIHRGWEIYPKGLYDNLIDIKNNYGNVECFIAENGMGVEGEDKFRNSQGYIDDSYRIEFIKEHLVQLHQAIADGCNCKGYHLWTFVDNWSWQNAYKNRYGFVELQRHNQLKRVIKQSGYWMKEMSKTNSFEWQEPFQG